MDSVRKSSCLLLLLSLLLSHPSSADTAECRMLDGSMGTAQRVVDSATSDSCRSSCDAYWNGSPCVAAIFKPASPLKSCLLVYELSSLDSQSRQFVKDVKSCQGMLAKYYLGQAAWSYRSAENITTGNDEDCKARCISDIYCIIAMYHAYNKACLLYSMDAVLRIQPPGGDVLFQWQYSDNIWVWALVGVGFVVLVTVVSLLVYCCCCRGKREDDPDSHAKVKKIFDPENPPLAPVKSKITTKLDKSMKSMPTPAAVSTLHTLLYYRSAVDGGDSSVAVSNLSRSLRDKMDDTLNHLADTICRTYFDSHGPFQLKRILMCESFTDNVRLLRKGAMHDSDINFFLLLDNIRISSEHLHLPYGPVSPYVQLRAVGDVGEQWREFVDSGYISPYRLKERLYKNLRQSFVPLCVGNSRVDAAFIVGISECSSVSIFEQRIESSIGNGISKVTPTAVPYKNSVPRSHYDVTIDLSLAIDLEGWPLCANEWVNRERMYSWPPVAVVEDIIRQGVHVVPQSPGPNEPLCFRVSFATSEKLLGDSLSPTRRQIYRSAKEVLRFLLSDEGKDLQDSSIPFAYCLKNIMFYQCEQLAPALWYRGDRMPERLLALLSQLEQCLLQGACPHYFVPTYNILNCNASEAELRRAAGMLRRCLTDLDLVKDALDEAVHPKRKSQGLSKVGVYRFRMASQKIESLINDAAASPSAVYEHSNEASSLIGSKSKNYGTTIMT